MIQGAVERYGGVLVMPQWGKTTYRIDGVYDSCGAKSERDGKVYETNIVRQG